MLIIVLGFISLFILLLVLLYLTHLAKVYKGSYSWPAAEGTIVACKIRTHSSRDSHYRHWYISINYKYSVEGETYRNSRIGFSSLQTSQMFSLEEQFKKQIPIPVYYNPQKPADSVLIPGEYQNLRAAIAIVGVIMFLVAIFVMRRLWELYAS